MRLCLHPENYRLQSAYENNLIIKMVFVRRIPAFCLRRAASLASSSNVSLFLLVFQFEFINSYLSLFYIGFYLKDMERLKEVAAFLFSSALC